MKLRKRYLIAAAYVAGLHLLALALLVKVEAVPTVLNKVGMIGVRGETAALTHEHPGLVFLGDSHTYMLGDAPESENYGKSGEVTAGLIERLPGYAKVRDASAVILMIGTNDIWIGKIAGLPDRLRAIVDALPAGTPVVWSAIPPADDFRIDPDAVREANRSIKALCAARPRCTFIDTWKLLADAAGRPIPGYFVHDQVHLSADGYRAWLVALDAALEALHDN